MYTIAFTKQAYGALRKLPRSISGLVRAKLDQIAADSHARRDSEIELQGRSGRRMRVDDWRLIYEVQDARIVVLALEGDAQGDGYR
jgi:mRNA interferase RelE/StbE